MTNHTHTPLDADSVARLLTNTEPWLSCDDCFEGHDSVVEDLLASGVPLSENFRTHLLACPACLEEARSLATLIAPDVGLSPDDALGRLEAALS